MENYDRWLMSDADYDRFHGLTEEQHNDQEAMKEDEYMEDYYGVTEFSRE